MGKKNYITEITDTFGLKTNPKEALKLAKKMKSAQNLAYPNSEYKIKLKDRLHNMYLIDQGADVSSRFSVFQIFGIFASFAFIATAMFMVFDVRQDFKQSLYQEPILEIQEERIFAFPTQGSEDSEVGVEQKEFRDEGVEDLKQTEQTNFSIDVEKNIDETILPVENAGMRPEENMHSEGNIPSNKIIPEVYYPEAPQASSSMIMDDMGVTGMQEMNFLNICNELEGILSDDEIFCILSDGTICEEHNIYNCSIQNTEIGGNKNIEINLEELIEEYGQ